METHVSACVAHTGLETGRTGGMLACLFVGRGEKPEKPPRSSSLSRPVNTARSVNFTPSDPINIYPQGQGGQTYW